MESHDHVLVGIGVLPLVLAMWRSTSWRASSSCGRSSGRGSGEWRWGLFSSAIGN